MNKKNSTVFSSLANQDLTLIFYMLISLTTVSRVLVLCHSCVSFKSIVKSNSKVKFGSTVLGWIKILLTSANIDTSVYEAYLTRSASTSNSNTTCLSVTNLLKRGSWSNKSFWQKFYNKPFKRQY